MTPGDRLSSDVLRMEATRTWSELEAVCRVADPFYERMKPGSDIRRAYENIKTQHCKRVAATLAA